MGGSACPNPRVDNFGCHHFRATMRTSRVLAVTLLAALCACPARAHNKNGLGVDVVIDYVATVNIPRGTAADKVIADGMIEIRTVNRRSIPPGAPTAISSLSEIHGKVAVQTIPKGSEILGQEFAAPSPASPGSGNKPSPSH